MSDMLADYLAHIQADFPALSIVTARLNHDGLMNNIVVINNEQVFRFAKNEPAQALLAYETQLLQIISRHVSLPIPHIEHYTENYMHYRYVLGVPLYRHTLLRSAPSAQQQLASELATFLQQLNAIPISAIPARQAAPVPQSRRAFYEQRFVDLQQHVYPLLWADQKAWIEDLFAPIHDGRVDLDAFTPVLIHRDLASYHILHTPETGHLSGVIDYGTAGAGDPAIDWACLINTYGESFVKRMHGTYPIDKPTIDRARFLAGALELEWALGGVQAPDISLLLVHLGRARDTQPLLAAWP